MYNLRKRPTYDDMMNNVNNPPIFKYKEPKARKVLNDIRTSNLLFNDKFNDDYIINDTFLWYALPTRGKKKILMLNKYVQKDDAIQNYDLFPDMFHKIDATSKYEPNILKNKSNNINQTIRYMLKHIDTPYSSLDPSPKPPSSSPADPTIYKPTPEPSPIPTPDPSPHPSPIPTPIPSPIPSPEPSLPPTPIKKGSKTPALSKASSSSEEEYTLTPADGLLHLPIPSSPPESIDFGSLPSEERDPD